jgi:hypothetical protein
MAGEAAGASVNAQRGMEKAGNTAFRSSMTSKEGHTAGKIVDGKVVGVNLLNWTVDVASTYDRHKYLNIQVGSPYLHFSNGEGFYAIPEVGAKCAVCLPSDSSPPFVLSFLMPVEKVADAGTPDAPGGTGTHGSVMKNATAARFDGGRPRGKPGDIGLRGRDGQFVILHRGGVLQIGANELSQRIFIPLDNHMLDISERYSHHNLGGSILWGLAEGRQDTAVAGCETYRVFANDKYADIRITKGFVANPIDPENPLPSRVVYEVVVAPKKFNADSGDVGDASVEVSYKFAMDRGGNISTTISGDVFCHFKKKLTIKVDDSVEFSAKSGHLSFSDGFTLEGGKSTHINGDIVRIGAGLQPVARKGDFVSTKVIIPVKAVCIFASPPAPGAPAPCTITFIDSLGGVITTGNDKVRV